MLIEYRDSKPLSFAGKAIGNLKMEPGINNVDVEIVKYLINNDYFKTLVDSETIILRESLPIETAEKVETVVAAKKRKTIEFTEEPE